MTGEGNIANGLATASRHDTAALEAFVLANYPRLVRLAGVVSRDVDVAQDAVQTALERAWRYETDLADSSKLRSWLDRIVVREALRLADRRRGRLLRLFGPPELAWIDVAQPAPDPADMAALKIAFAELTPGHRAVVALHLYAGYSVEETAHSLKIPADTVRSRLRAARKRLRQEMSEAEP